MVEDSEIQSLKEELSNMKKTMQDIKTTVDKIEYLERSEIRDILLVKSMESKELDNLDTLENLENQELSKLHHLTPKKFKDINSWKSMVWERCDEKVMIESKRVVSFKCKLIDKFCSFETCPKNKVYDNKKE